MEFRKIDGMPDYASLIELINAEWPEEFGEKNDADKVADMIESHDTERDRSSVLLDDGEIVGFYRYTAWPRSARETDTAHTYDIAVLPFRQNEGLGSLLMQDMMKDCSKQGFKRLLSRSFRNNEGSIRLHKRFGFKISLETEDSIVWEISLS